MKNNHNVNSIESIIEKLNSRKGIAIMNADRLISYDQLSLYIDIVSQYIRKNCRSGSIVAVLGHSSWQVVVSFFAVIKAGCIALLIDSTWSRDWIESVMMDAQPSIVLSIEKNLFQANIKVISSLYASAVTKSTMSLPPEASYVIYTSGTTGKPKGVINTKLGLNNLFQAVKKIFTLSRNDIILQFASPSFDAWMWEVCQAFSVGAALFIPEQSKRLPGNGLEQCIMENHITVATLPPSVLEYCSLEHFKYVHTLITAGERCSKRLINRWSTGRRLFNAYGPSEAAVCATIYQIKNKEDYISIGAAIPGVKVWVVNKKGKKIVGKGSGELIISGKSVGLGYLNLPELTAKTFTNLSKEFHSGDLVDQDKNGLLFFKGRIDSQVKVNGVRIELDYVEKILETHQLVKRAIVTVDIKLGLAKKLVAFILISNQSDEDQLRIDLAILAKNKLSAKLSPIFIFISELPMRGSGKVDIKKLMAEYKSKESFEIGDNLVQTIISIFKEYLGIKNLSIDDDFFRLGGTSIGMLYCLTEIEKVIRKKIPVTIAMLNSSASKLASSLYRYFKYNIIEEEKPLTNKNLPQLFVPLIIKKGSKSQNVFITGSTGLLGAYVIKELLDKSNAKIYCIVRAVDNNTALDRVKKNLIKYKLWSEKYISRIICFTGNIDKANFGLSNKDYELVSKDIGFVYHIAANVSWVLSYDALYQSNVASTNHAIKLSLESGATLLYVSSIGIHFNSTWKNTLSFNEDNLPSVGDHLLGYLKTKWMSEKLIMAAAAKGLSYHIFRPPFISPSIKYKSFFSKSDFLSCKIQTILKYKIIPDNGFHLDVYPADFISKQMVICAKQKNINNTYQLTNNQKLVWKDVPALFRQFGYSLQLLPYRDWVSLIAIKDSPMKPHFAYIQNNTPSSVSIYEHHHGSWPLVTNTNLKKAVIDYEEPPAVIDLLKLYI